MEPKTEQDKIYKIASRILLVFYILYLMYLQEKIGTKGEQTTLDSFEIERNLIYAATSIFTISYTIFALFNKELRNLLILPLAIKVFILTTFAYPIAFLIYKVFENF